MSDEGPRNFSGGGQSASCGGDFGRVQRNDARLFFSGGDGVTVRLFQIATAGAVGSFLLFKCGDRFEQRLDDLRGFQILRSGLHDGQHAAQVGDLRVDVVHERALPRDLPAFGIARCAAAVGCRLCADHELCFLSAHGFAHGLGVEVEEAEVFERGGERGAWIELRG